MCCCPSRDNIVFCNLTISTKRRPRDESRAIYILCLLIDFDSDVFSYIRVKQRGRDDLSGQIVNISS